MLTRKNIIMKKAYSLIVLLFTVLFFNAQNGNVGINTVSPTNTLDINGTLRVRKITQIGSSQSAKDSIMVFDTDGVVKYVSANSVVAQASAGNAKILSNNTLSGNGSTGNELRISQQGATTGQVLTWNGTTWIPQAIAPASTTNNISSSVNTITSNVNGVISTAPIVNSNTLSLSGSILTSNINGITATQNLSSLQTITTITNTQAAGKTIATYTNENNVASDIKETITNLSQNTTTGVVTYTKEDATTATANVVSTNANNVISVGTDGGAYKGLKVFDAYDTAASQTINNTASTLSLGTGRTNIGGIFTLASNTVTISEAGVYRINYSVGTTIPVGNNEFSSRFWLENGGTEIVNSNIIIHAYNGSNNCSSRNFIIQLAAGSALRIRMQRVDATNMQTIPSCTALNIEKLN